MNMQSHEHLEEEEHIVGHGLNVVIYLSLLVFTGITVWVASMNLGAMSSIVAVLVASMKAALVLLFFMHLYYDKPIFRYMFVATVVTYGIFIALTYTDTLFR